MWGGRKRSLLVEAQTGVAVMKINVELPQKLSGCFVVIRVCAQNYTLDRPHATDLCGGGSECKTLPVSRTEKEQSLKAQAL